MAYIGKSPTAAPLTSSDVADDIITLAKMAGGTDGNIITYDASGDPAVVAVVELRVSVPVFTVWTTCPIFPPPLIYE